MVGKIVGSYRIVSVLGEGGMGVVYLAEHVLLGRRVAVKMLRATVSSSPDLVNRFFNEARTTSRIHHPGLVELFDFGYHEDTNAYIVMEYLEGESLGDRLARQPVLPSRLLIDISRQVAAALGAAHEKEVIHRDLKPDNVFLLDDPEVPGRLRVKVFDFGLAKLAWESASTMATRSDALMGTPSYMSPEQCRGAAQVDRRTDIYSLGCVMFEMACGQPPFRGEGPGDLIAAHIHQTPPPPRELAPALSPQLAAVIMRALAKQPDARYPTMAALGSALDVVEMESAHDTLPIAIPIDSVGGPAAGPNATDGGSAASRGGATPLERLEAAAPWRPSPTQVVAAIAGLLGLAVGGAYLARLPGAAAGDGAASRPAAMATAAPSLSPAATPGASPPSSLIPPSAATAEPPAAPARRVTVRIDSRPSGADVFRAADGIRLGRTPFVDARSASAGEAVYLLKLRRYREQQIALPADRDGGVLVRLARDQRRHQHRSSSKTQPALSPPVRNNVIDPFQR